MELGGLKHDKRRVFLLSQTHSSETVGLAACRATLEECLRIDISRHIWSQGKKLVDGFRAMASAEGVADYVRIVGFDCNPQIICTRPDGTPWPELNTSFHEELISWGVLMPWITITYSHGQAELDQTFEGLQMAMRKISGVVATGHVRESFEGDPVKPVFRSFNQCLQSRCARLHQDAPPLQCCID
jgi:glutamate-1-semialdehyde 2,1-aminomutase